MNQPTPAILIPTINPVTGLPFASEKEKQAYKEQKKLEYAAMREQARARQQELAVEKQAKQEAFQVAVQKFAAFLEPAGLTDEEVQMLFGFEEEDDLRQRRRPR